MARIDELRAEKRRRELIAERDRRAALSSAPEERTQFQQFQERPIEEKVEGIARATGSVLASGIAEPIAGIAGIVQSLNPFADEGAGARAVETVREGARSLIDPTDASQQFIQGSVEGLTGVATDILGGEESPIVEGGAASVDLFKQAEDETNAKFGPLAATVLTTLPIALLEAVPALSAFKKAKNLPVSLADEVIEETQDALKRDGLVDIDVPAEARDISTLVENIKKGKTDAVAIDVRPDQEIVDAAERLGVNLNPSSYSTNRAFIDVQAALKSKPGSTLSNVDEKAIIDIGQSADDLITSMGGATDRSLLDLNISEEVTNTIKSLEVQARDVYKNVDDVLKKANPRVKPLASRAYIDRRLAELGGEKDLLSPAEKQLLDLMDKNPTYGALDTIRKNVGSGYKGKGPFKDVDRGNLDQVYKVLSEDQQGVADVFGVGADYSAARGLVSRRKALEESASELLGRDLNKSILPKITQAATALTKGDALKFNRLMELIPEPRRKEVAATLLNDIFTQGGRRQGRSISGGFVGAFDGLNRNAAAKNTLFEVFPPFARKRFDDIGKVSKGLFKSLDLENKSRTARDILAAIDDGSIVSKVYDVGKRVAVAEAASTSVGLPGAGSAAALGAAIAKPKTAKSVAADNLFTSPEFRRSITLAGKNKAAQADNVISKSAVFKRWLSTQPTNVKTEVAAIGFIPWLTRREEEE